MDFFIGKDVGETSHAHGVRDLLEFVERGAAYALRRRILGRKLRILFLQSDQLIKKLVVFVVGNFRRILDIIQTGMVLDCFAQLRHSFFRFFDVVHGEPPFYADTARFYRRHIAELRIFFQKYYSTNESRCKHFAVRLRRLFFL